MLCMAVTRDIPSRPQACQLESEPDLDYRSSSPSRRGQSDTLGVDVSPGLSIMMPG